jgi:AMP phosphorylase
MKLRVKTLNLDAGGKTIVVLNSKDARELGVYPLNRLVMKKGLRKITVVVNTSTELTRGKVNVYKEVEEVLKLKSGDIVSVKPREELESKKYIDKKLYGGQLTEKEMVAILKNVIDRDLNDLELASFITALEIHGLNDKENYDMTKAMTGTGKKLKFRGAVCDKHSIGSLPGDKSSLIVVPIIAAAGLKIPKTSSRAITSAAGTADRMEVLAPVNLNAKSMKRVVKKTNGCIVWGGSLDLAPADDIFIEIEQPLNVDPLLIPSVLSKKLVAGSKYVVIVIPYGKCAKVKNMKQGLKLGKTFKIIGKKLGMKIETIYLRANQPVGYTIGAGLEAREALIALMDFHKASKDLVENVEKITNAIFKMAGRKDDGLEYWKSGMAEDKMREIIKEQGGNPRIKPEQIKIGKYRKVVCSSRSGIVICIDNIKLIEIAKSAGAPEDKGAGILLNKKLGDKVKAGERLFTVCAENKHKLKGVRNCFTVN